MPNVFFFFFFNSERCVLHIENKRFPHLSDTTETFHQYTVAKIWGLEPCVLVETFTNFEWTWSLFCSLHI